MESSHDKLEQLVDRLFILDYGFREHLKKKALSLSDYRLEKLNSMLMEIFRFQQKKLVEHLSDSPAVFEQYIAIIEQSDHALLEIYRQMLVQKNEQNLQQLLTKLNSI